MGRQNEHYNAKLFQWINQSLGGIKELKILQREEYFIDSYKINYKKLIWGARVNELIAALPKYIVETVAMVGLVLRLLSSFYLDMELWKPLFHRLQYLRLQRFVCFLLSDV